MFVDQALRVMRFAHRGEGPVDVRERWLFDAQRATLGLLAEFAAGPETCEIRPLLEPGRRVRAWVAADPTRVTCFAIEVSEDGGRTWTNPLP